MGTTSARARQLPPSAKVYRYVQRVIGAYDTNGDGQLQQMEWSKMRGQPVEIDGNKDGLITKDEFVRYVTLFGAYRRIRLVSPEPPQSSPEPPLLQPKSAPPTGRLAETGVDASRDAGTSGTLEDMLEQMLDDPGASADAGTLYAGATAESGNGGRSRTKAVGRRRDLKFFVPASRLPPGLPSWFHTRDSDGDGQITLAEYAAAPTTRSESSSSVTPNALSEFRRYDRNSDGVITGKEIVEGTKKTKAGRAAPSRTGRATQKTNTAATPGTTPAAQKTSPAAPDSTPAAQSDSPAAPENTPAAGTSSETKATQSRRGSGGGRGSSRNLMQYDKDGDGKVTKDEAPEVMQRYFDRIDSDGDGAISREESEAIRRRRGGRRG